MKGFASRELNEAKAHAMQGGQALHIDRMSLGGDPLFARYWEIARLFDQNLARLIATARALGIRVIRVKNRGTRSQQIELCGRPFKRAKELCQLKQITIAHQAGGLQSGSGCRRRA